MLEIYVVPFNSTSVCGSQKKCDGSFNYPFDKLQDAFQAVRSKTNVDIFFALLTSANGPNIFSLDSDDNIPESVSPFENLTGLFK